LNDKFLANTESCWKVKL